MPWVDELGSIIRRLVSAPPPAKAADDIDSLSRQYASAMLAGDDAEMARVGNLLSQTELRGQYVLPQAEDLAMMAERFPPDANIIGGPVKTAGQSRALSRRPDVGGLSLPPNATLEDAIALQEAMDRGSIIRGTVNTDTPTGLVPSDPRESLMSFFGNKAEKARLGLDQYFAPTRGDLNSTIIDDIQTDQLLGLAAARKAEMDAMPEAEKFIAVRESRNAPLIRDEQVLDAAKKYGPSALASGGLIGAGLIASQMSDESDVIEAEEPVVSSDPLDLAEEAEEAAEADNLFGGSGSADNSRLMNIDDLASMGVLDAIEKAHEMFDDDPLATAELSQESKPLPGSTPVVVSQKTVYRTRPSRRRSSSRRRKPNYAYSRARNPSQSRGRR